MELDQNNQKLGFQFDGSKLSNPEPGFDPDVQEARLPLRIDDGIIVRSLTMPAHIARSRIIGATHGEYILITEPSVPISDRLTAILDESFLCSYFNDGLLYNFQKQIPKRIDGGCNLHRVSEESGNP